MAVPKGHGTAEEGRFPYMCSLMNQFHKHMCSGVLIAPRVVITAAHCVADSSVEGAVKSNLLVSVGAHTINDGDSANGALVSDVMKGYNSSTIWTLSSAFFNGE